MQLFMIGNSLYASSVHPGAYSGTTAAARNFPKRVRGDLWLRHRRSENVITTTATALLKPRKVWGVISEVGPIRSKFVFEGATKWNSVENRCLHVSEEEAHEE